jgi:hypothetical protein
MNLRRFSLLAFVCAIAPHAQENPPPPKASISGTVEDSVSHQCLDGYQVILRPGRHSAIADAKGGFEFKDLDPGTYRLRAWKQRNGSPEKLVSVNNGQKVSGVTLKVDPFGIISGTVADENGEPVAHAEVYLVARDYYLGQLRYILTDTKRTDDRGQYTLEYVHPNYNFLVYATYKERKLEAIFERSFESQAAEEDSRADVLWRSESGAGGPSLDIAARRAQGRHRCQIAPDARLVYRIRQSKPVAQLRANTQRIGVRSATALLVRLAMPGKISNKYSVNGAPIRRHDSTTERIAATLGPDCTLPTCSQFLRPSASGRIEFSARLLDSSISA